MLNLKSNNDFKKLILYIITKSTRPYNEMKNTNIYMVISMMNRNVESELKIPFWCPKNCYRYTFQHFWITTSWQNARVGKSVPQLHAEPGRHSRRFFARNAFRKSIYKLFCKRCWIFNKGINKHPNNLHFLLGCSQAVPSKKFLPEIFFNMTLAF